MASKADLTPRQWEIAVLVSEGLTAKEIGERLFISHHTVQHHLDNPGGIYDRLGTRRITAVAAWVERERILQYLTPMPGCHDWREMAVVNAIVESIQEGHHHGS